MDLHPTVDSRRAQRRWVNMRAQLREGFGPKFDIEVLDLSSSGFRCETYYGLAVGTRIFLHIPTFSPFEALVAWKANGHYGCQFDRPLYPSVFETIAARFPVRPR